MKTRVFLFLFITINSAVFVAAQENSDPKLIIEGLRRQMKELDTLKANYTVDTIYGASNKNIQYKVAYIKSGDKFNMSEYAYDGDEQIGENRTVYDGIDIKIFHCEHNIKAGTLLPKSFKEAIFQNNIC